MSMAEMRGPPRRSTLSWATFSPLRLNSRAALMTGRPCERFGKLPSLMSWGEGAARETEKRTVEAKTRTTDRI